MTVDQFQEISLAIANKARAAGALLADFRRINIRLTRAKHKLAIIAQRPDGGGSAHDERGT